MNEYAASSTHCASQGNHDRSLGAIVAEIKTELSSFATTRVRMLKAELQESMGALKAALPIMALGLVLFFTAFLLLTSAAVVLVASAFAGNPYAWFFAFIIIGCLWGIFGGIVAYFAVRLLRGRFPKRTVEVLKADKLWLQNEARAQL